MKMKAKAVEDYLDFLLAIRENCESKDAHHELDDKIGEVVKQLIPLQSREVQWAYERLPLINTR